MCAAVGDLARIGHAVAAALRIPSRKAADDRGEMDAAAELLLADAERREPAEQTATGGVRERAAVLHFVRSRRLPDQHHARVTHGAGDRRAEDVRAGAAGGELREVAFEFR